MPIYSYRCEACGFTQDVLQKIADPQLTACPSCGKPHFQKQLSAPSIGSQSGGVDAAMPPCAIGGGCNGCPCG